MTQRSCFSLSKISPKSEIWRKKTNKKTGFENLLAKWQTDKIPKIKKKKNLDRFTNTSTFCCCRKKKKFQSRSLKEWMEKNLSLPSFIRRGRGMSVTTTIIAFGHFRACCLWHVICTLHVYVCIYESMCILAQLFFSLFSFIGPPHNNWYITGRIGYIVTHI